MSSRRYPRLPSIFEEARPKRPRDDAPGSDWLTYYADLGSWWRWVCENTGRICA